MADDPWVYYGLFSRKDKERITRLLDTIPQISYEAIQVNETKEVLRAWNAWDENALNPHIGYHIFIHEDGVSLVGDKLVDLLKGPH